MATVTGIVESARKDGRFVLEVDGKIGPTVSLEIIDRLALRIGKVIDDGVRLRLDAEAAALQTYDRALNLIAFQARSARDLRRRLVQKGEDAALVDAAIERLVERGLLNDADFARQLTRSKVLGAGASKRRVQQELFKKGVARETADEAIAEVFDDEAVDEQAIVDEAARKKVRSLTKLDVPTRRRRLYAFLARKGYDGEKIRLAMQRVLDAEEASEAGEALLGVEDDE
jgi:regulatory protein